MRDTATAKGFKLMRKVDPRACGVDDALLDGLSIVSRRVDPRACGVDSVNNMFYSVAFSRGGSPRMRGRPTQVLLTLPAPYARWIPAHAG
jgi:hypothetical protein